MKKLNMGTFLAIGIGVGVALGTTFDNLAVGIGIGAAIGTALGAAWSSKSKNPKND